MDAADSRSIWQRNYHEHIIRDEHTLRRIRRDIETNSERRWKS
jgi:REP element-mobilizing transposase RayT